MVTVGGSGVGRTCCGGWWRRTRRRAARCPGLRMVVVTGPRIDPALALPAAEGLEVRGYVPDLYRHLAACDLAVVQGGLTTTMELTAQPAAVPLRPAAAPLRAAVPRAAPAGAAPAPGRCMDYDATGPGRARRGDRRRDRPPGRLPAGADRRRRPGRRPSSPSWSEPGLSRRAGPRRPRAARAAARAARRAARLGPRAARACSRWPSRVRARPSAASAAARTGIHGSRSATASTAPARRARGRARRAPARPASDRYASSPSTQAPPGGSSPVKQRGRFGEHGRRAGHLGQRSNAAQPVGLRSDWRAAARPRSNIPIAVVRSPACSRVAPASRSPSPPTSCASGCFVRAGPPARVTASSWWPASRAIQPRCACTSLLVREPPGG